jgi:hypothetical protein
MLLKYELQRYSNMGASVTDKPIKRGRGRPPLASAPGVRFMVHLPEGLAAELKLAGDGSLSRGIMRQAARRRPKRAAK